MSGSLVQRARLFSGLVLFSYVLTHFINHALGLWTLEAMLAFQEAREVVTRSLPGTVLLLGAISVHVGLALAKIASRQTVRMPLWEATQIATGLAIPLLLIDHIGGSRLAHELFEIDDNYMYMLRILWPGLAQMQMLMLVLVWIHACIGLHFWLRLSPTYRIAQPLALASAVSLPLLAVVGFVVAGRTAKPLTNNADAMNALGATLPDWMGPNRTVNLPWNADHPFQQLDAIATMAENGFIALVALAVIIAATRMARGFWQRSVPVTYSDGTTVNAAPGTTLLEVSRSNGIAHMSVCGGRARCSTCRVKVLTGLAHLEPPSATEAETLARVNAAPDVRLACQVRVTAPVTIARLVRAGRPDSAPSVARMTEAAPEEDGIERTVCVLFFDLRGFTALSASRLPYDVVYLLNETFAAIGAVIERRDGWIDKYMGDGLLAVFGRETDPQDACRSAMAAAAEIGDAIAQVNAKLASELPAPLGFGIGLHAGSLVIGRIGHPATAQVTVIGSTVNASARLEDMTAGRGVEAIVSDAVLETAGLGSSSLPDGTWRESLPVRGLDGPLSAV
ncbi:MAG: adenylate/guanylate cyclase domain-containing protein, partial [Pseudomonadota bacterium]